MNDVVPSSFLREATALFHSPKSKTVAPSCAARRASVAERGLRRSARASLATSAGVGRHHQPLAPLGASALPLQRRPCDLLVGLGLAVEQHLEQPAPNMAGAA